MICTVCKQEFETTDLLGEVTVCHECLWMVPCFKYTDEDRVLGKAKLHLWAYYPKDDPPNKCLFCHQPRPGQIEVDTK
jgi:hypothetical protein